MATINKTFTLSYKLMYKLKHYFNSKIDNSFNDTNQKY